MCGVCGFKLLSSEVVHLVQVSGSDNGFSKHGGTMSEEFYDEDGEWMVCSVLLALIFSLVGSYSWGHKQSGLL